LGYTQYLRGYVALSDELIADVENIIRASKVSIRGGNGQGSPTIANDEIIFNGDSAYNEDYETFVLVNGVNHRSFVKTAHMPYDEVVCAVLLRAGHYSNKFKVSSDGTWDNDDWQRGRDLYEKTFGEAPVKPDEVRDASLVGA